jgi:transcriptional regulator with XRE-family HTH domain
MDKEILLRVGTRLRDLRKERGFTQEALGEKGGFHFSYIGQIERGEKNVALLNLAKIAKALNVDVSQLFTYTNLECNEESQADIQEITYMLNQKDPQQIAMAKNVLREIFNNR